MTHRCSTIIRCIAVSAIMSGLAGCALDYYWQAATGHLAMMRKAEPVDEVMAAGNLSPALRDKLTYATEAVKFAHDRLLLPDNGSYSTYADLGRPYAVWNVVAAGPLTLEPRTWCFPVAGCVSYRGYFSRDSALAFAERLRASGDDVFVGGVPAYSTLGRFADPLLNTMMSMPDYRLAGTVFHELAHQRLYVRDDTPFNEGFASFVEAEGVRRWLLRRGDRPALCRYLLERRRRHQVIGLLGEYRAALSAVYAGDGPVEIRLEAKAALMASLVDAYGRLKATWVGPPNFDHWFSEPFNNARFAVLTAYDGDVPAFDELLARSEGDLEAFYRLAARLAAEPADERRVRLDALRADADQAKPDKSIGCPASG